MAAGIGPRTKGAGIRSWTNFLQSRFGPETMPRILARAPRALDGIWPETLTSAWYPVAFLDHVWDAVATTKLDADHASRDAFFRELGRFIAEDNLNSVYRFLLSLLSPDRVLGMTPRLWSNYFEGLEITVTPGPGKSGTAIVSGLGPIRYLAPTACGWLTLAYEKCGAPNASVTEENWEAGRLAADPMIFHHRW